MKKGLLTFFARRYIAGRTIEEAIDVARKLKTHGILSTIDNLGENVTDAREARGAVDEYLKLLDAIEAAGVDSTISLKLTHMGLDISDELASRNVETLIKRAAELENFVRFDMEGSGYTERTINIFLALRKRYENTGIAIQACLRRSAGDRKRLIEEGASVRLCKGAYKEPPEIAFPDKKDVDKNFSMLMKELLCKGTRPAIATHDEKLIDEAKGFAREKGISKDRFEFQMLLGIKRTLQKRLAQEGFKVRVYVPYGPNWLPYILRRMRERKENVFFVLKNIFD